MELDIMVKIILMICFTFLFVALFIPIVKKIANHIGALDIPNERKVHKNPMPRLGGLGIYAGFLFGYMVFCKPTPLMNSVLIGSFIIIIGLLFKIVVRNNITIINIGKVTNIIFTRFVVVAIVFYICSIISYLGYRLIKKVNIINRFFL